MQNSDLAQPKKERIFVFLKKTELISSLWTGRIILGRVKGETETWSTGGLESSKRLSPSHRKKTTTAVGEDMATRASEERGWLPPARRKTGGDRRPLPQARQTWL